MSDEFFLKLCLDTILFLAETVLITIIITLTSLRSSQYKATITAITLLLHCSLTSSAPC